MSAEDEAKKMGDEYVSVEHIFLTLIAYPNNAVKAIFKEYGITRDRFLTALQSVRGNQQVTSDNPEATYDTLKSTVLILSRGQGSRSLTRLSEGIMR